MLHNPYFSNSRLSQPFFSGSPLQTRNCTAVKKIQYKRALKTLFIIRPVCISVLFCVRRTNIHHVISFRCILFQIMCLCVYRKVFETHTHRRHPKAYVYILCNYPRVRYKTLYAHTLCTILSHPKRNETLSFLLTCDSRSSF